MINTITSSQGGVLAVVIDDFNTTSIIDTYSGDEHNLPRCLHSQFPPLAVMPPAWAAANTTETQHTISLVYIGASPKTANATNETSVQFDSFAIPIFTADTQNSSAAVPGAPSRITSLAMLISYIATVVLIVSLKL
jgi:hypothetical protein